VKGRTDEGAKRPGTRRARLLAAWCTRCCVSWHRIGDNWTFCPFDSSPSGCLNRFPAYSVKTHMIISSPQLTTPYFSAVHAVRVLWHPTWIISD